MNTSGITPVEYQVLVSPREIEKQTRGGVLIPDSTQEREGWSRTEGILVAASPLAFHDLVGVEIGERVMFGRHAATKVTGRDGKEYWLMKDSNIVAVVEQSE